MAAPGELDRGLVDALGRVDHGHAAGGGAHAAGPLGIREDRLCGLVEASAVAVRFADDGGRDPLVGNAGERLQIV